MWAIRTYSEQSAQLMIVLTLFFLICFGEDDLEFYFNRIN
jgi:hypothetical protein